MKVRANPYIAAAAAVEAVSDGAPKKRIQLLPLGTVELRDGRGPFTLASKEAAHAVVEETRRRAGRQDIMVDYDHQSFYGAVEGVGGRAEAAGWLDPASLSVEDDGIWADVTWTDAAAARLAAREYRYISPLFTFDPATKAVRAIRNAGLTNTPAIEDLAAVASEQLSQEQQMSFAKIALALGLVAAASEEQILESVSGLKAKAGAGGDVAAAAQKLGLAATATVEELVAAASKPDPAQFVPIAVVTALQDEVAGLKSSLQEDKAEQAVAAAMKAGKISPAMEGWATEYAKSNPGGFASYVDKAPVIVAAGERYGHLSDPPPAAKELSPEDRAVAASLGLSEADFLAAKGA